VRVAYFTDSLPPITDGVARTLTQLADTLLAQGVEFSFFSAVAPGPDVAWRDRVHRIVSVPFPPYPYYRVGLPLGRGLDPIVDRFAPDLIHVVSPTPLGLYGLWYARHRGVPVVSSFHTDFVSYFPFYGVGRLQELGWRYLAWFCNQCAVTYAPSATTAAELRRRGIGRVELWDRGIDANRFSPVFRSAAVRETVGASRDRPLLLFVGRLVREKNLAVLAAAVELLERRGDRFVLCLVGDGPMREELRTRLPQAHFAGMQHGQELARWYASADIFVFPSTTETFGNAILEAFASGLPAVGAARGGVRDLIDHGFNGLLAEPDSADDFARQVHELLERPAEVWRLGRGAERTASQYRWAAVNGRLLESYRRVIAASPRTIPNARTA
jgi:glycosyltransferase involved in cell wall biosynthesis